MPSAVGGNIDNTQATSEYEYLSASERLRRALGAAFAVQGTKQTPPSPLQCERHTLLVVDVREGCIQAARHSIPT